MIRKKLRYKSMLVILGVFLFIGVLLFVEQSGIQYRSDKKIEAYLNEAVITAREAEEELPVTCLVLMDSTTVNSLDAFEQFEQIFRDMKVGYQPLDLSKEQPLEDYSAYETVVVLLSNLSSMKEQLFKLCEWVENGGNVLFAVTLEKETYVSMIEHKLGIISSGYNYEIVESIYLDENFMLGGGKSYIIMDPYDSARGIELDKNSSVYAWTDGEKKVPLIWKRSYGKGNFVVDNFGLYEKATRGFYAASYSLLTDVCTYPVINASLFFLDDFPSPVPSGNDTYIMRDFQMSIADFYTNVWWPDILKLAEKYGVRYTGVMIETYKDDTSGDAKRVKDTERFLYYGNMLLHQGGELGYHGYNHQPLALSNTDYGELLPYHTWKNRQAMINATTELMEFAKGLFPTTNMSVYVPPSNVLSKEGREMLAEFFPSIKAIASSYFPGDFAYEQEFEVANDGNVELPRVISGCILDDYMQMTAVSELNMHYVNSHFMHPDDLLDEDRGATLGWKQLYSNLSEYMAWLYHAAPNLRNLTGSEGAGAVQRYAALMINKVLKKDQIILELDNFYDEAYLMLRMNEGEPGEVSGGSLEHLTGNLYLLHATNSHIVIVRK